ncbi:sodium-dependent organic anion transporter-like [Liolophura sinensis]|uniref:sodium-dependent organic anion transporter-like n=1 Tax=Liolophura sinensis TaxID=3198878 RepID=UPI003158AAFE
MTFWLSPGSGVQLTGEETLSVRAMGITPKSGFTHITLKTEDPGVAVIPGNSTTLIPMSCSLWNSSSEDSHCFNFSFEIQGVFLGRTHVLFYAGQLVNDAHVLPVEYNVAVLRPPSLLANIFTYTIIAIVAINTIGFGCSIDLEEMRRILKKPIPPAIGLGCQFVLNPLIAYGLGQAVGLNMSLALGLFSVGSCPGGGASNMWTYLLDGDLNLSILMTFMSTIAAFAMLPLWMYTLGQTLIPENVEIPFSNIFYSLISLVVPCVIGILIKRYFPKAANIIRKLIKPIAFVIILLILSVGIYSNLYMFTLMKNWRVLVCGLATPYSAYVTSAMVAWIGRQPPARILTISIETAIQNTAIAMVLILTTFPEPEASIAAVMPVTTVMFTPFPLIIFLIIKTIRARCCLPDTSKDSQLTTDEKDSPKPHGKASIKKGVTNISFKKIEDIEEYPKNQSTLSSVV